MSSLLNSDPATHLERLWNQLDLLGDHNPVATMTRYHWDRVIDIANGKKKTPLVWEINPSGICNLKCHFCLYPDGKSVMPKENFFSLVNLAKEYGAKAIIIAGDGEPLVHPQIEELMWHVKNQGLDLFLFTNGTLIGRKVSVETIVQCCTMIIWGIYGATPESYKKITQMDMFEKAVSNVQEVVRCKKSRSQLKASTPVIVGGWVGVSDNAEEAITLAELGEDLGVDWVYVRNDVTGEGFESEEQVHRFADILLNLKNNRFKANPNFVQGRVLFDRQLPYPINDREGLISLLHPGTDQWAFKQKWLSRYDILYVGPRGDLRVSNRKEIISDSNAPFVLKNLFESDLTKEGMNIIPDIELKSGQSVVGQTSGRKALVNLFYNLVANLNEEERQNLKDAILQRYKRTDYSDLIQNYF